MLGIEGTQVKIEVTIDLSRSLLTSEENIQESLNEAGCLATVAEIEVFRYGRVSNRDCWGRHAYERRTIQSVSNPYGEVIVNRHVYQRSGGGKTYCPLERDARIIITRVPLFAKQVSSKFAYGSAREVQRDLSENHARSVAVSYIQRVSKAVARIIESKEEEWEYVPPKLDIEISSVAIGLDGTMKSGQRLYFTSRC